MDQQAAKSLKPEKALFHILLIKPTHYDDDGYAIQWKRMAMPSNTLACLNGLLQDFQRRQMLGPDVGIRVSVYAESTDRVRPDAIIRELGKEGDRALILLAGVQSNQFPRAVDLARSFRKAALPVCIGGFHVSGCIAMLPEMPADMREAHALGVSFFAGEAEGGTFEALLRDAWFGTVKPIYNHLNALPSLEGEATPILPADMVRRINGSYSSVDMGRGCPFQCSFCTIINVQGRKSRSRSPDDVERVIRENYAQGIKRFLITDDNFARNTDWEILFNRVIELREKEFQDIGFTIQVDTLCHKIPNFIEKAGRAGVEHVFIGLENINPDNLIAAKKRQNKITDYRVMLQKWREQGVITLAGYILGFPGDTKESIVRDIEIIKRELPLDILEFFFLTPLPGSEDHKIQSAQGGRMDPDTNKYDLNHRVAHHPKMTDQQWDEAYRTAWDIYYTPEHLRTILRRAAANRLGQLGTLRWMLLIFATSIRLEGIHPMETGLSRMKFRRARRHGLKLENPLTYYPRHFVKSAVKLVEYWLAIRRMKHMIRDVASAADRWTYSDLAIAAPKNDEYETLDLYHLTNGGEAALTRKRRDDAIRTKAALAAN